MTQNIRTKWHKLVSLVAEDEVYLTAPKGGKALHWSGFDPIKGGLEWVVTEFEKLPKFVVDSDLLELVMSEGYEHSLLAMKDAKVLRSPFPAMLIEFDYSSKRYIVMLRDQAELAATIFPWESGLDSEHVPDDNFSKLPFYGIVFQINSDEDGEYLVMSPSVSGVDIKEIEGKPWVGMHAQGLEIFKNSHELDELIKSTYVKDGAALYRALACAMLVMHTEGVKREVVECHRLNKHRVKSNKPSIPTHTVLSIGRVYRSSSSDTSDVYNPRKSPRPHWRRGHKRTVYFGVNRASVKEVYINPKLVAFKDYDIEPSQAKEYVIKK